MLLHTLLLHRGRHTRTVLLRLLAVEMLLHLLLSLGSVQLIDHPTVNGVDRSGGSLAVLVLKGLGGANCGHLGSSIGREGRVLDDARFLLDTRLALDTRLLLDGDAIGILYDAAAGQSEGLSWGLRIQRRLGVSGSRSGYRSVARLGGPVVSGRSRRRLWLGIPGELGNVQLRQLVLPCL